MQGKARSALQFEEKLSKGIIYQNSWHKLIPQKSEINLHRNEDIF